MMSSVQCFAKINRWVIAGVNHPEEKKYQRNTLQNTPCRKPFENLFLQTNKHQQPHDVVRGAIIPFWAPLPLTTYRRPLVRLRVVSNFGDRLWGGRNTRARAKFRGDAKRGERRKSNLIFGAPLATRLLEISRARVYFARPKAIAKIRDYSQSTSCFDEETKLRLITTDSSCQAFPLRYPRLPGFY